MATDTVRAFQYERGFKEAIKRMSENPSVSQEDVEAITLYVDSLLAAMHLVNRELSQHTAGGSEYWDERGSVYGSLLAVDRIVEHSKAARRAFAEERKRNMQEQPR